MNMNNDTILHILFNNAKKEPNRLVYTILGTEKNDETYYTYHDMVEKIKSVAGHLITVEKRKRILLVFPNSFEFIYSFFGVLFSNSIAIPAKMPVSDQDFENIMYLVEDASIDLILTTASCGDMLQEKLKKANKNLRCVSVNTLEDVDFELSENLKEINSETIGLIQYTSGSISKPKGIMVSHKNILMGVKAIGEHFEVNQQDKFVTWLPCYHSMGLIANIIAPIFCNGQCVMLNAEDFVRQPIRWLEAIDKYSGTISGAPNFAYELCTKRIKPEQCENLNLSKWRVSFCGSEKVNKDTIENFREKFSKYQLVDSLISPCYGLSEATLLVSSVPSKEIARSMCINDISYVSCGKIASDVILKIVDSESKTECKENEIGEVWIAGDVVTKGYFNKLDETEQVYHNKLNGIASNITYLNTGDLGFINNGELFITGRMKSMMIFSGKNYFCEDIESMIEKEMFEIFSGGCISFSCDIEGTEKLVIVQGIHKNFLQKYNLSDLICLVSKTVANSLNLEVYDVVITDIDLIPRTSTGKKQHQICKQRYLDRKFVIYDSKIKGNKPQILLESMGVEHNNIIEKLLDSISCILDITKDISTVDMAQPLYLLGINSVKALQLQNLLQTKYGLNISLLEIKDLSIMQLYQKVSEVNPVLEELAIASEKDDSELFGLNDLQVAYVAGRSGEYELSNSSTYVYFEYESANIETDRLKSSFSKLVSYHDMLRVLINEDNTQSIISNDKFEYELLVEDLTNLDDEKREEYLKAERERMSHQIIPLNDSPYFEIKVFLLPEGLKKICIGIDLLIADGRSVSIIFDDWKHFYYEDKEYQPLQYTFRDYVKAESTNINAEVYAASDKFWDQNVKEMNSFPILPTKQDVKSISKARFKSCLKEIDESTWKVLKEKARDQNITVPALLLSVYAEVLSIWSGMKKFSINVTSLDRKPYHADVDKLVGQFATFIILNVDMIEEVKFINTVNQIQNELWSCLDKRQIGGNKILQKIRKKTNQYVEAIMPIVFTCILDNVNDMNWMGENIYSISQTSQVWLDNQVYESDGALLLKWDYVDELFPDGMISEMQTMFCHILMQLAHSDDSWNMPNLRSLPAELTKQRSIANKTECERPFKRVDELFAKAVQKYPENIAIVNMNTTFTYKELDYKSNLLFNKLNLLSSIQNEHIAIYMEKGWEQIVAVLGIIRSGCAYLPIDITMPDERVAFILKDADIKIVVTQEQYKKKAIFKDFKVLTVNEEESVPDSPIKNSKDNRDELAYIIYTSGSTGVPKGVAIGHEGLSNAIESTIEKFNITEKDKCIAITNLHHDMSIFDIWGMLCVGGTIVIPNDNQRKEPDSLAKLIKKYDVTIWNSVPSIFDVYVDYIEYCEDMISQKLNIVFLGGDWINKKTCEKFFKLVHNVQIVSVGGPTETTLWNIWYPFTSVVESWDCIPYGYPISNTKYYILDDDLNECPDWVTGNICSSGVGICKGYINDIESTNQKIKYIPGSGERIYISGDLGNYLPDGSIKIRGRKDNQIKINGVRIELEEIEKVLREHQNLKNAKVLVKKNNNVQVVVAYLICYNEEQYSLKEIKRYLKSKLPKYMIPTQFILVKEFPMTTNNKINTKELLNIKIKDEKINRADKVLGYDDIMFKINAIVKNLLNLDSVANDIELSELGATSIDLIKIINQLEREFNYRISIEDFFANPTIEKLSKVYAAEISEEDHNSKTDTDSISGSNGKLLEYKVLEGRVQRELFKRKQLGIRNNFDNNGFIELERPDEDSDISRIINLRKSHRHFSEEIIPLKDFSLLLYSLSNISQDYTTNYLYGSGGGTYSIQVYLSVKEGRIQNVDKGIYYYHPKEHRLIAISPGMEAGREIHWTTNKEIYDESAFSVFLISQFDAIGPMYGKNGMDFIRIEAGEIGQILEMQGQENHIGFCQIGNTDFHKVKDLFKLDNSHIYLHCLLGGKLLDLAEERKIDDRYKENNEVYFSNVLYKKPEELRASAYLSERSLYSLAKNKPSQANTCKNIFLTGCTGFLGAFLLKDLLEKSAVSVYCLVRADSIEKGLERIKRTFDKWGITIEEKKYERIIPILGSLEQEYIGLSKSDYDFIAQEVDIIIHNAARVNWLAKFETLAPINVDGTRRVVELACEGKIKHLIEVSSLSVFPFNGECFAEDAVLDHNYELYDGYTQSKWAAEKTVQLAKEAGLPVTIVRPNLITGHSETGVFSKTSFFENMVKSIIQLRVVPETASNIDVIPVDYVSKVITEIAFNKEFQGKVYNLANPQPLSFEDFLVKAKKYGIEFKIETFEQWKECLFSSSDFEDNALFPFWTYVYNLRKEHGLMGQYFNVNARYMENVDCLSVETLMDNYMDYYIKTGFIKID